VRAARLAGASAIVCAAAVLVLAAQSAADATLAIGGETPSLYHTAAGACGTSSVSTAASKEMYPTSSMTSNG